LRTAAKGKRLVILLKLHGSTSWFTDGSRIVRGPEVYADEEQGHHNVLIYPAKRKVAVAEPFFTSYFCLHEILANSRAMLAIGYSFRDYDALTRIMSAQRRNPDLRVGIVSPDADKIAAALSLESELNSISPFLGKYDPEGKPLSPLLDNIGGWLSQSEDK